MAIEITDDGATIKFVDTVNDKTINFNKRGTSLRKKGNRLEIIDDEYSEEFDFGDVTIPSVVDSDALISAVEGMLESVSANINASDLMLAISRGNIQGISHVNKFGRNSDVDTSTDPEDVWDVGGLWVPPTTARIHDIVSTSALDTNLAGTGARTIKIIGLDSNFDIQEEDIELAGLVSVPTINSYTRIYRMFVLSSGSSQANAGNISATAQTDATVTAQINTGNGQTQMAIYTVPNGKTAYLTRSYCSVNRTTGSTDSAFVQVVGFFDIDTSRTKRVLNTVGLSVNGSSIKQFKPIPYVKIPEKTDIVVTVLEVSSNDTDVSAGFDLILIDN